MSVVVADFSKVAGLWEVRPFSSRSWLGITTGGVEPFYELDQCRFRDQAATTNLYAAQLPAAAPTPKVLERPKFSRSMTDSMLWNRGAFALCKLRHL